MTTNPKVKIITILGTPGAETRTLKSALFRQMVNQYSQSSKVNIPNRSLPLLRSKPLMSMSLPKTKNLQSFPLLGKEKNLQSPLKSKPLVNYAENLIKLENNFYKLIDTPAFPLSPATEIEKGIREQIENLLARSSLILWVVDKLEEKTLLLKKYLKKTKTSLILVINESEENYQILHPQFSFVPLVSVKTGKIINLTKLTEQIVDLVPSPIINDDPLTKELLTLLIFGPPNSGKSTLMNCLLCEKRSLVTPIAGTTREPVVSQWNWKNINFRLIDTCGITKEKKIKSSLWKKCDLAWAVIDASLPLIKQILQIIQLGEKENKPLFIIVNKIDLIEDKKAIIFELKNRLKSLSYCPIICLSALKGTGISSLIECLNEILKGARERKTKIKINEKTIKKMIANHPPSSYKGRKLKIHSAQHERGLINYFTFFVNNPQVIHFSYRRYMINYLRKKFSLKYLPIKLILKEAPQ